MIKNLESPIFILHQESALFTMECLLFTMEGLQFRKTCVRNQHTNQSKHSCLPRVMRLDKMLLLFRETFYSIHYATWENLKEIMSII